MSIREFIIDRDDMAHLVDQVIHDMEGIGDASAEGGNGMGQLFVAYFWLMGSLRFECQSICIFLLNRDVEPPWHTAY